MIIKINDQSQEFEAEIVEGDGQYFIELWDNRKHVTIIRNGQPTIGDLKELAEKYDIG